MYDSVQRYNFVASQDYFHSFIDVFPKWTVIPLDVLF